MALCANFSLCGRTVDVRGRCSTCLALRMAKPAPCPLCNALGPLVVLPCGHESCIACASPQCGYVNPFLFPGINPPFSATLLRARCKKCDDVSCTCLVPDFQTPEEALEEFVSRALAKKTCLQCPGGELPGHANNLVQRERPDDIWGAEARQAHQVVQGRVNGLPVVEL